MKVACSSKFEDRQRRNLGRGDEDAGLPMTDNEIQMRCGESRRTQRAIGAWPKKAALKESKSVPILAVNHVFQSSGPQTPLTARHVRFGVYARRIYYPDLCPAVKTRLSPAAFPTDLSILFPLFSPRCCTHWRREMVKGGGRDAPNGVWERRRKLSQLAARFLPPSHGYAVTSDNCNVISRMDHNYAWKSS